jgi:ADP-heptose:LPS heptosyltransferase
VRILIIQLRRIGDILLTTPAIRAVKNAFPDAQIDFLAEPCGKSVLETNPHIHELMIYDKEHPLRELMRIRQRRYTAILDFMGNPRCRWIVLGSGARWKVGWKRGLRSVFYNVAVPEPTRAEYVGKRKVRMVEHWLHAAGIPVPKNNDFRPELFLSPEDIEFAEKWMAQEKLAPKSFAVFAPASRYAVRRWKEDRMRDTALGLFKKGTRVFLAWGPGEEGMMADIRKGHEGEIGILPASTMRQMGAIFAKASLVLSTDSGLMHTAVSVKIPTVGLYGPTRSVDWNPSLTPAAEMGTNIVMTAPGVDCLGCHLTSHCPVGHICMERMETRDVLEACESILGRKNEH